MLKPMPTVKYGYNGKKLTLNELYKAVRKKRGRARILASILVTLGHNEKGEAVKAKYFIVKSSLEYDAWKI
ncbi:MAG: Transposase domain protein [Paenibacillus sp.]|jgi:hypothetical protein|nr:Transposase domain protein [Paenibacillus sp.]